MLLIAADVSDAVHRLRGDVQHLGQVLDDHVLAQLQGPSVGLEGLQPQPMPYDSSIDHTRTQ